MIPFLTSRRAILFIGIALTLPAAASANAASDQAQAAARTYKSTSLAPVALDTLRRKVLVQCGLESATTESVLPWYFHFEYGRALLDAGDARRAVIQLNQSINLRPEPQARKRTYGMWFLDYLPYFELAEAHAMLANWPCAEHAMQLSESSGEIDLGRIAPKRIHALQERIDRHLDEAGSCDMRDYQDSGHGGAAAGG